MIRDLRKSLGRRPFFLLALQGVFTVTGLLGLTPVLTAAACLLSAAVFIFAPKKTLHLLFTAVLLTSFLLYGSFVRVPLPDPLHLLFVQGAALTAGDADYTYAVAALPDGRRIVVYGKSERMKAGHTVTIRGPVSPGLRPRNPGGFDEANWVKSLGAVGTVRLGAADRILPPQGIPAEVRHHMWSARRFIFQSVRSALPERLAVWVAAFSGGGSRALDEQTSGRLSQWSLSHLTSVSGMHVGFLLAPFSAKRLRKMTRARRLTVQSLLMCWIFFLADGQSGVTRAVLMRQIGTAADAAGRFPSASETIAAAIMLMLAVNPFRILQTGFWLSVTAAGAIQLLGRPFERGLRALLPFLPSRVTGALAVTSAAQCAVLPLVMVQNEVVTPASILLNVLLSLAAQSLTLLALAAVTLLPLFSMIGIARVFLWLVEPPLSVFVALFEAVVNLEPHQNRIWLPGYVTLFAILLYVLAAGLITAHIRRVRFRRGQAGPLAAALLLSLLLTFAAPPLARLQEPPLTVWFLDVGQGDAAVLSFRNGTTWLIDGGDRSHGLKTIWPFMKAQGIASIDLAIVSHGHNDHAGGVIDLLQLGKVRQVALNGLAGVSPKERPGKKDEETENAAAEVSEDQGNPYAEEDLTSELLAAAEERGVPVLRLMPGDALAESGAALEVLAAGSTGVNPNDLSLQIFLRFDEVTMLFTGDATSELEAAVLSLNPDPVTVLKVAHHGSRFTTGVPFVEQVSPALAVISVGYNTYGHPSPDVLSNLAAVGSRICRTDHSGAIRLRTDGKKVDADTWLRTPMTSP